MIKYIYRKSIVHRYFNEPNFEFFFFFFLTYYLYFEAHEVPVPS